MEFTKTLIKGKLVRRYKRFFVDIKVNSQTTDKMVYGEIGRTPLHVSIETRMVCFWRKAINP